MLCRFVPDGFVVLACSVLLWLLVASNCWRRLLSGACWHLLALISFKRTSLCLYALRAHHLPMCRHLLAPPGFYGDSRHAARYRLVLGPGLVVFQKPWKRNERLQCYKFWQCALCKGPALARCENKGVLSCGRYVGASTVVCTHHAHDRPVLRYAERLSAGNSIWA